jgi:zinc transport system substrate-binding protein
MFMHHHETRYHLKRAIMLVLALVCIVGSVNAANPQASPDRLIMCSFYPVYIMTLNIAAGVPGISVRNMTKPQTGCLHDYQLTPQDMQQLSTAWIFVILGAGMESFLDKALKQRPALTIVDASKGLALMDENPHLFVSIAGAIGQVKNIRDGLVNADPANAQMYVTNGNAYIARLEALQQKMHAGLATLSSRSIVTFHEAFPYFAREFNLDIVAVIEREPGSQPSAGELAKTITIIRQRKVRALFAEPQYPESAAQTIGRETGGTVYFLDPAVTGPDNPDAYITIMESNLAVLKKALQ